MSTLEARIAEVLACGFSGCVNNAFAKGYCSSHLSQQRRKGVMTPIAFNGDDPIGNFWKLTSQSGECKFWTGPTNRNGYGRYSIGYDTFLAHRWIFETQVKQIPRGMELDHTCHNPPCVNLDHLRIASHKQNLENIKGSPANAKIGIRGVSFHKQTGKYAARVKHHGKVHSGGLHDTPEQAGRAAQEIRLKLFTHNNIDRLQAIISSEALTNVRAFSVGEATR